MQGLGRVGACEFSRFVSDGETRDVPGPDEHADLSSPLVHAMGMPSECEATVLCDGVIDLMAALFSVSGRQLRSPKRQGRAVSRVRQIGMYIAHTTLGLRMAAVATGFGRDKSTVMYACHLVEDMRDDIEFDRIVGRAERVVRVAFNLHIRDGGDGQ